MGNPDFAIPTLRAIRQSGHELISVVSNPPKQMGRGRTLSYTQVGKFSKENDIPLLEPESLRSEEFINRLNDLKPDIFVVVAYRILPNMIIEIPTYGAINLHASLLPLMNFENPNQQDYSMKHKNHLPLQLEPHPSLPQKPQVQLVKIQHQLHQQHMIN